MPARFVPVLVCLTLPVSLLAPGIASWAAQPERTAPEAPEAASDTTPEATAEREFADPFDAYEAGEWDQALQGFLEQQNEDPDDPAVELRIGSTRHQMGELDEAARVLGSATAKAPPALREKALYNLGNTAYRQGRLTDAVELYRQALDLDPDDEDAKFNLEFVQREIERRKQEQQQQQQQRQQDPQNQDPNQDQQQQQQPQDDSGEQQQQGPQESPEQQPQPETQAQPSGPDQDGDGLPDETEREAENPTDPENPDTDGDGLQDGAEDHDRDGRVDPGETDPNRRDSDGDGIPDGQEEPGQAAASPTQAQPPEGLTEEEALRYLMALEEGRPERKPPEDARAARAGRSAKDW